jgi:hypothetical protein
MTSDERIAAHESAPGPRPMRARPVLQVLSWLGGVAAGGAFISLLTMTPGRVCGATRASRLQWQQRCNRTEEAVVAPEKRDADPRVTLTGDDDATCAQDGTGTPPAPELRDEIPWPVF